jgi:polysaccharide biosynthesis protein PelF
VNVLLSMSGTYPHFRGGVSVWAHQLVTGLPAMEFKLISIVSNPNVTPRYALSSNVRLTTIPLWGAGRPEEFHGLPRRGFAGRPRRPEPQVLDGDLLAHYETVVAECMRGAPNPEQLGHALAAMARFFRIYDFYTTMRHPEIWDTFLRVLTGDALFELASVMDAVALCRRMERYLRVLTAPIHTADLSHVAIAGIAGVPAILAKIEHGVPMLLTEHGVYYRERLLDLTNERGSTSYKVFLANFEHALVRLSYAFADLITPVCRFNSRWEVAMGAPPAKLHVVYNGVDTEKFSPRPRPANAAPRVVSMGRVDRLKDTLNLIEAMAYVHRRIPAAQCLVYGEASDPTYRHLCLTRIAEFGLERTVTLQPATREPERVYREADVVVSASLSEGFPFGVIEAMACGSMVVATDVGGVGEALEGSGILVPPRAPEALGAAIVAALRDDGHRRDCGARARQRVVQHYQLHQMLHAYQEIYERLAIH